MAWSTLVARSYSNGAGTCMLHSLALERGPLPAQYPHWGGPAVNGNLSEPLGDR